MQVLTQVLCRLVSSPEYIEPLRQEVEEVIAEEGWTKAGMDKMRKLDSILRETQRIDDLSSGLFDALKSSPVTDSVLQVVMYRLALRPFTFSNGVTIPAGTLVGAPLSGIHMDEDIYSNPRDFDGFRFSKLSESNGDTAENKHQAVTTSPEHLAFGFGRSAWWVILTPVAPHTSCNVALFVNSPGRYFAVNHVKALVAHIITTYDIKAENYERLPRKIRFASPIGPKAAEVLFRKRQK
jgi:hypothetical protein